LTLPRLQYVSKPKRLFCPPRGGGSPGPSPPGSSACSEASSAGWCDLRAAGWRAVARSSLPDASRMCAAICAALLWPEALPGSTLGKALRYEGFICELADFDSNVTFYQRQYPDRFAPEVLFLVPRPERADSINRAL